MLSDTAVAADPPTGVTQRRPPTTPSCPTTTTTRLSPPESRRACTHRSPGGPVERATGVSR